MKEEFQPVDSWRTENLQKENESTSRDLIGSLELEERSHSFKYPSRPWLDNQISMQQPKNIHKQM